MSESVAAAGHASARKPAMSVFERFLTFWVALCIIVGIALGQLLPGVFHVIGDATVAQVNLPVAVLVWLMIVPMLLKIDLAALARGGSALARHRHHGRRQLADQAVLDGAAGLDLHRASVPAVAAGGPDQQLHRRPHPAGGGALHGHGVRLVEPGRWRAAFHAVARWRSTTRSWWWPSRRSWGCCSASPRSPCRGTRCSFRSCSTSSCR